MGSRWGVDTASQITSTLASGANYSGNTAFWGRYFLHTFTPSYRYVDGEAANLVNYTTNIRWIVPICSPSYALSGGSYSDGINVATDFCNYISARLNSSASPKVHLPTLRIDSYGNPMHRVYLDVEPDAPLTQDFWNGWATGVYNYAYGGHYPFFACAYINPNASNHCYIVGGNSGSNTCHGYWSQQPQTGSCWIPGPTWNPTLCSSVIYGPKLWQYQISCSTYDYNMSTPANGDDETYYMLYIY